MSAKYKSPSFLLPNEINTNTNPLNTDGNPATGTGINSLYSMEFNGSNYIDCGNISTLNGATQATWSCWFKKSSSGYFMGTAHSGASTRQFLAYQYGSDGMVVYMGGGGAQLTMFQNLNFGANTFVVGTWYHLAFVYNASEASNADKLKFYLNGTAMPNTVAGSNLTSLNTITSSFFLGAPFVNTNFSGQLDEVAIFNRALNTTEIAALYNGTGSNIRPSNLIATNLNPIAYYPLGEQAQNTGYIQSNGSDVSGSEWQFPNGVLQDYVMDFDSTSPGDAITSNTSGITGNSARTVSFWYNIGSSSSAMIPFSLGGINDTNSNSQFAYCINRMGNSTYAAIFGRGGNDISPITVPATNDSKWHNVIITYTGSTLALYIDGSNITLPSQPSSYATTDGFKIGGWSEAGNRLFDGQMSNVAIWNSDQSTNKDNIYNNGSPQTSYTVTPQNWWKLNADSIYTPSAPNYTTALDFDGNNNLVNANSVVSSISSSATGTVSGWIKYTTGGSAAYMITFTSNTNTSQQYLTFQGNSNGVAYAQIKNQWILQTNNAVFTSGNWYHFTVTQNGTEPKIYINGTEYSNGNGATLTTYGGTDGTEWWPDLSDFNTVTIGGMIWNSGGTVYTNYGNQDLSNISIFNSALTPSQVSTLFNFGTPETAISFSPQAWWKLDNTTTGIQDSSGNGNNGTNNGTTQVNSSVAVVPSWKTPSALPITAPNYTTALDFDGSDYISFPFNVSTIGTNNYSTSFWFNYNIGASELYPYLYGFGIGSDYQAFGLTGKSGDTYNIRINNRYNSNYTQTISTGNVISAGVWYNVTITRDGNTINCYLNGDPFITLSNSDVLNNNLSAASFKLGYGDFVSARYFNSKVSNFAIFNTALSPSQVSTLYNVGTPETAISFSPVSWWKLDNLTTGLLDSGSASNNGTNNGATQVTSDVVTPQPVNGVSTTLPSTALQQSDLQFDSPYSNYSLDFDGTNYIDCGTSSSLDLPGNFSISFWFNADSFNNYTHVLSKMSSGQIGWRLQLDTTYIRLQSATSSSYARFKASRPSNTNQWYHVVFTYDGTNVLYYLDGQATTLTNDGTSSTWITPVSSGENFRIARSLTSQPGFNGKIDETSIFNYALSSAQILEIYNNGKPKDLSSLSPTNWWRLGENAYFDNNAITVPNSITGAPNGVGPGTVVNMLSADAPGTYANGVGTNLDIVDRVGDAPLSVANSQSYNMIPDDKVPYVYGYIGDQISNTHSMALDGVNDYFDLGAGFSLLGGDFTFSAWIKAATSPTGFRLLHKGEGTTREYAFGLSSSTGQLFIVNYNGSSNYIGRLATGSSLNTDTWKHVVATYGGSGSASNFKLYVDGVEADSNNVSSGSYSAPTSNAGGDVYIGRWSTTYAKGSIDEVAIFDTALSADQVKFDLYNATTTGKTADIEKNTNLPTPVAWYRMGD